MNKNETPPKEYKPDMLQPDTWYGITINPDNAHQYFDKKRERIEWVTTYLMNYHLHKLNPYGKYELYPEISLPKGDNVNGKTRIHYHGKIKLNIEGIFILYMYILNALKGIATVEITDNYNESYYTKNKDSMVQMCKMSNMPYCLTDTTGKIDRLRELIRDDNNLLRENKKMLNKNKYSQRRSR